MRPFLRGLQSDHDIVAKLIRMSEQSYTEAVTHLIIEESLREESDKLEKALPTRHFPQSDARQNRRSCYNCGRKGPLSRECKVEKIASTVWRAVSSQRTAGIILVPLSSGRIAPEMKRRSKQKNRLTKQMSRKSLSWLQKLRTGVLESNTHKSTNGCMTQRRPTIFATRANRLSLSNFNSSGYKSKFRLHGSGNVRVRSQVDGHSYAIVLTDFTYEPEITVNLISQNRVRKAIYMTMGVWKWPVPRSRNNTDCT